MPKKSLWIAIIVLAVIAVGVYFSMNAGDWGDEQPIYIAVIVPPGEDGNDAWHGAELFAAQYNQENGGINGHPIELLRYDDENKTDIAKGLAEQIAQENRAMVVLGHAQSPTSSAASPIYAAARIPAITGSATLESITLENDWYFRVIPNSLSQSQFVAEYAYNVMGYQQASVVYDVDSFGASLALPFQERFTALGGTVSYFISYDPDTDREQQFSDIINTLAGGSDGPPGLVYFAGRAPDGADWIVAAREAGQAFTIIGPSSFTNIDFISNFNEYEAEQLSPGKYSDGILAVAPVIFDVAGVTGQAFFNDFRDTYGLEPGMKAATNYDAMAVAVRAMVETGATGDPDKRAEERQAIRDFMAGINTLANAVDGATGLIYFDENRDVVKPVTIAEYRGQRPISALTQLQPVLNTNRYTPDELQAEVETGHMLLMDNQYSHVTNVVYTGLDMIEISNLDLNDDSVTLDFYIWFRHQGDFDAENIVFINSFDDIQLGDPIAEEEIAGYSYKAYRVKGNFTTDFQFQDYPFDTQQLVIRFRHANETRDRLIYVRDDVGMQGSNSDSIIQRFNNTHVFEISGWTPSRAFIFQDIARSDTTLGNPRFFETSLDIEYSRFNMEITIERDVLSFSIKNLLPLVIMLIFSYSVFFIPVSEFSTNNGLIRGVLLTVAFFHLKLSSDLPGVDYVVALDYVFYMLYALFVIEMVFTMIMRARKDDEVYIRRLSKMGQIGYPLIILIMGVFLYFQYFPLP